MTGKKRIGVTNSRGKGPKTEASSNASSNAGIPDYSSASNRIGNFIPSGQQLEWVSPNDKLQTAISKMRLGDFSQLPVMNGTRNIRGVISWASISWKLPISSLVAECRDFMDPPCIVPENETIDKAIGVIVEHEYVLVQACDNRIIGIITACDFAKQYHKLAEPFLLIGEIEDMIRSIIDKQFTLDEIISVRDSSDGNRTLENASDLTFGEYIRLLENPERWSKSGLPEDRQVFIKALTVVREIRNKFMHFAPDPIADKCLPKLQRFAAYLRKRTKQKHQ